jgi:hypothetical protein
MRQKVNLCDFYSYSLIGELTAFLHFQEFNLRKPTVTSSTCDTTRSPHTSKEGLVGFSIRLQLYVLLFI